MIKYFPIVGIAALVFILAGCPATRQELVETNVTIDKTFGNYGSGQESNLVLITMTPEEHARLTTSSVVSAAETLPPKYFSFLENMSESYGLKRVADWPLPSINIFCIIFENEGPQPREALLAALAQEPGVESAQIVQNFSVQAQEYNDPFFSMQHGFHSIQAFVSHYWSRGKGIRIAVVDTGLDDSHPDLASRLEEIRNFVDRDEDRFRSDIHGTAVGGVIAAAANNSTGIVGVAPEASLLPIKACWYGDNASDGAQCNTLTLAKALNYSIKEEVDIINLSLTGPPDPLLNRLVEEALSRNIVVVGAKPVHDRPAFPVSVEGTIAVAMNGQKGGAISAPGRQVISTQPNEQYDFYNGSSFSAAHISGLAAVIRSMSPALTPAQLLELLEKTADPNTGAVNACRAVSALEKGVSRPAGFDRCGSKGKI